MKAFTFDLWRPQSPMRSITDGHGSPIVTDLDREGAGTVVHAARFRLLGPIRQEFHFGRARRSRERK